VVALRLPLDSCQFHGERSPVSNPFAMKWSGSGLAKAFAGQPYQEVPRLAADLAWRASDAFINR